MLFLFEEVPLPLGARGRLLHFIEALPRPSIYLLNIFHIYIYLVRYPFAYKVSDGFISSPEPKAQR